MSNFSVRTLLAVMIFSFTAGILINGFNTPIQAQDSEAEDIRRKFRQVIQLKEQGEPEKAGRLLDEVLRKLNTSSNKTELVLELRDEAGFNWFVSAMSDKSNPLLSQLAEKFLKMAALEKTRQDTNITRIRRLVNKLGTKRHNERYYIMEVIATKIGQYVFKLPELPGIIGDPNHKLQIPVILLLTRMGDHAVRPLIECTDSSNGILRQNAALIMGNIKDPRSIPCLAKLAQKDGESRVKEAASKSLAKIVGKDSSKDAKNLYFDQAEKYYFNDPLYTNNPYKESMIWKWSQGNMKHWEVPSILFNESLAQEALFDAIALDNSYDAAWTLLLNVYFSELNEVNTSLRVALDLASKERLPSGSRGQLDVLRRASRTLRMVNICCSMRGKSQVYKALQRALNDKRAEVAVSCIETLRDLNIDGSLLPGAGFAGNNKNATAKNNNTRRTRRTTRRTRRTVNNNNNANNTTTSSSSEGAPLINALTFEDKRVRYAAAEALARVNPARDFSGSDKVVEILGQAISEKAPRTVLVVSNNPQVKNAFRANLTDLKYDPFIVESGDKAIQRALSIPTWDLIIVSDHLPKLRAWEVIDKLKNDYRTKHIPIFVMAKPTVKDKTSIAYDGRAKRVIGINITKSFLSSVLKNLFDTSEYKQDVKGRTISLAKKAAEALAGIPVRDTRLRPETALNPLIGALSSQPDEVKIPCMHALANLQNNNATPGLRQVFENKTNNDKVRVAAALALGEIMKNTQEVTPGVYKALKAALQERSHAISLSAGRALGKVPMTPQKYTELFNLQSEGTSGPFLYRHVVRLKKR